MRCCEYCGAELIGGRSDRRYCNAKHRTYASRQRLKEREQAVVVQQSARFAKLVEQLRAIAPRAAQRCQQLVERVGLDCAEQAVALAVAAYREGQAAAA